MFEKKVQRKNKNFRNDELHPDHTGGILRNRPLIETVSNGKIKKYDFLPGPGAGPDRGRRND